MFRRLKPSEILNRLTLGKGKGYELDDVLSNGRYEKYEEEFISPLLNINSKYSTDQYILGIDNPASLPEIRDLASKLDEMGL